MISGMFRRAHKFQIFRAVVGFIKIFVMDNRSLAFKSRNFSEQSASGDNPMRLLHSAGIILLNENIAVLVGFTIKRHQRFADAQIFGFEEASVTKHKLMVG